jgi:hypothetical protein
MCQGVIGSWRGIKFRVGIGIEFCVWEEICVVLVYFPKTKQIPARNTGWVRGCVGACMPVRASFTVLRNGGASLLHILYFGLD